ncbi:MAG: LptA/OstA family protein [Steroidobacteraceae bacterium]
MRQSQSSGRRRWRRWSRIAPECLAALLLGAAACDAQTHQSASRPREPQPPIAINAGFSRVDYNNDTVVFRNIVVSQGEMRLRAERAHASGVGFANSQWTFEDQVVIDLAPRGTVRCDRAVVTFHDNRITSATATGKPAQFEQHRAHSRAAGAHGRADRIVYDAKDDSVRLSGNASFSDARGLDVTGPLLEYDIRNERLQAASPGGRRGVHITVSPGARSERRQPPAGREPRR